MSETPKIDELKDLCGSDKLHHCIQFMFCQEIPLNESMIMYLGAKRDEMRMNVDERTVNIEEVLKLDFDEEKAADDGYEFLHEVQVMERRLLESLQGVLIDLRALITKKQKAIAIMDKFDDESSN